MKRVFFVLLAFLISSTTVFSQKIEGIVYEEINGQLEPVPFVNVSVQGTTTGANTDFDGRFTFAVPAGIHKIDFRFVGYKTQIKEYQFKEGEKVSANITLKSDAEELGVVMVEAKQNRESETALLMEQKKADVITQTIGANELSRKGVSDVATGLTKIAGVSVVSGNSQMFVRGLGDRYNSAMLNGLPIASPNPELKVIPMDIFPTDIVENIGISKVFLTDRYADYSGALVDISTKSYPEEAYLAVGIKGEYNTQATGESFRSADGGSNDFWGFDDGTRSLPNEIANTDNFRPASEQLSADPFGTTFGFDEYNAPLNIGFKVTGGKKYDLKKGRLGIMLSGSFDNDYNIYEGVYKVLNAQYEPRTDYDYKSFVYSTNISALANVAYELSSKSTIRFITLFVNSSEDELSEYYGLNRDQGQNFFTRRSTYREHSLFTNQLIGDHKISKKLDAEWGGSFALANSEEPDRKQLVWVENQPGNFAYNSIDRANNNRFYSEIIENEISGRAAITYKLRMNENETAISKIKSGVDFRSKTREFNARQFNYDLDPSVFNGFVVDPDDPTNEINDKNIANNSINIIEQISPSNTYYGYLNIYAFYANYDFAIGPRTNMGLGLRYEYSDQTIEYKKLSDLFSAPFRVATLEENNIYPNLNVKHSLTEKSNLRGAVSRTISRPEFKEMAPFLYEEIFGGSQIQGNDSIQNAYNYNFDLKYELFSNSGELFAISLFGRYLQSPIERVVISSSTQLYSFQNANEAYVGGIELEYNKKLKYIFKDSKFVEPISFGFNCSYLHSQIKLDKTNSTINTNSERALQGASPYLVNADLNYEVKYSEHAGTMFTLTYNVFGPRIYSVGTLGAGDIYERPVNTIDFLIRSKVNKRLAIDISAKNLINPNVTREQETDDEPIVVNSLTRGTRIGVSATYTF